MFVVAFQPVSHITCTTFFHSSVSDYQSTSSERCSDQFFGDFLIIFNLLQPSSVLCHMLSYMLHRISMGSLHET